MARGWKVLQRIGVETAKSQKNKGELNADNRQQEFVVTTT
tara:strand:+ start:60 stop:179 length:120 start_codon:yes stop_codon:yes gene_type:complete